MNIKDLIAEVRAHNASATPAPWLHYKRAHPSPAWAVTDVDDEEEQRITAEGEPNDIALIAHYRTAAPLLADEVERLNAANEELRITLAAERGRTARLIQPVIASAHLTAGNRRAPLWSLVAKLFAVGSTSAAALCSAHRYDPDQEITRYRRPKMLHADAALTPKEQS